MGHGVSGAARVATADVSTTASAARPAVRSREMWGLTICNAIEDSSALDDSNDWIGAASVSGSGSIAALTVRYLSRCSRGTSGRSSSSGASLETPRI